MEYTLNEYHRNISDEELLEDVKLVAERLSQNTLTKREYIAGGGRFSNNTFLRRFGSWISVIELCGLKVTNQQLDSLKAKHTYQSIETEALLNDIRHVADNLGKTSISSKEYNENGKFSSATCFKRFSSWSEALSLAGLMPYKQVSAKRLDDIDMLNEIENIWIKLGRQPTSTDIKKGISKYSLHAYCSHFGSWRKTLRKFVEYMNENTISQKSESKTILSKKENEFYERQDKKINHETTRDINLRLRFKVMQRDNFKCCICGAAPATNPAIELQVDHIIPWSKGGETVLNNLQTLCSKCNLGKSNLDM